MLFELVGALVVGYIIYGIATNRFKKAPKEHYINVKKYMAENEEAIHKISNIIRKNNGQKPLPPLIIEREIIVLKESKESVKERREAETKQYLSNNIEL